MRHPALWTAPPVAWCSRHVASCGRMVRVDGGWAEIRNWELGIHPSTFVDCELGRRCFFLQYDELRITAPRGMAGVGGRDGGV